MLRDISIHRPIWMGFDDLKHIVMRAVWVAGSLKSGALNYEVC